MITNLLASPFGQWLIVVVVALLPAYVLGRFLPSDAAMTGPFQKLTVSFTGSFALYLFILLAGGAFIGGLHAAGPRYETVEIKGKLRLDGAEQQDLRPHQVTMVLHPPRNTVSPPSGNGFTVSVETAARRSAGEAFGQLPQAIIFQYPGYISEDQELRSEDVDLLGRIDLGEIVLSPKPATLAADMAAAIEN